MAVVTRCPPGLMPSTQATAVPAAADSNSLISGRRSVAEPRDLQESTGNEDNIGSDARGGRDMAGMVLNEDEALELLAFLVTAARTQVDEAAEYGSLRLLTAAGRLADAIADRVSPDTRAFLSGPLGRVPELAVRSADPAGYAAALDALCRAMGELLVTHFGLGRRTA